MVDEQRDVRVAQQVRCCISQLVGSEGFLRMRPHDDQICIMNI